MVQPHHGKAGKTFDPDAIGNQFLFAAVGVYRRSESGAQKGDGTTAASV
jgi:hypothetical protein